MKIKKELQYYTMKETCEIMHLSSRSIYNYITAGQLEGVKVGNGWRISEKSIEKVLKNGTRKGFYIELMEESKKRLEANKLLEKE